MLRLILAFLFWQSAVFLFFGFNCKQKPARLLFHSTVWRSPGNRPTLTSTSSTTPSKSSPPWRKPASLRACGPLGSKLCESACHEDHNNLLYMYTPFTATRPADSFCFWPHCHFVTPLLTFPICIYWFCVFAATTKFSLGGSIKPCFIINFKFILISNWD